MSNDTTEDIEATSTATRRAGGHTHASLAPGSSVGRFQVLGLLGAGGMGEVYGAYDPDLNRRIALKIVRADGSDLDTVRLTREAQALARLNHPNVVTVYEVHGGGGFVSIAMEYVEGRTLKQWIVEHRTPSGPQLVEVLQLLAQAGRGLAAAHKAGMVHRDFKPANVLVGNDGRARVADFGLAQSVGNDTTRNDASLSRDPLASSGLTRTGTAVGTPAYMAPEQRTRGQVGPRSDQYSFCLTAWEALFGVRPAHDTSPRVREGVVSPRLVRSLRRGLGSLPSARFRNITTIVDRLHDEAERLQGRGRSRTRWFVVGAAAFALPVLGYGGLKLDQMRRAGACADQSTTIDEVWNPSQRQAVIEGLTNSGASDWATAASQAPPLLDDYADAWNEASMHACQAHRVTQEWNDELALRASWCLAMHKSEFASLVGFLASGSTSAATNSVATTIKLEPPSDCSLERWLVSRPDPPTIATKAMTLGHWRTLGDAALVDDPHALDSAIENARTTGRVEFARTLAMLESERLIEQQRFTQAAQRLEAAYIATAADHQWNDATRIAGQLAELYATTLGELRLADHWLATVETARSRSTDPNRSLEAESIARRGMVEQVRGEHTRAIELLIRANTLLEGAFGSNHPDALLVRRNIAVAQIKIGKLDEAERWLDIGFDEAVELYGADSPRLLVSYTARATIALHRGDLDTAKKNSLRALAIASASDLRGSKLLATSNLGLVEKQLGNFDAAKEHYTRAIELAAELPEAERGSLGAIYSNRGSLYQLAGDMDAAHEDYKRAIEEFEKHATKTGSAVATTYNNLATIHRHRKDDDAVYNAARKALSALEAPHYRVSYERVRALKELGFAECRRGDFRKGIQRLEDALAAQQEGARADGFEAWIYSDLAHAVAYAPVDEGGDWMRARDLMLLARQGFAKMGAQGEAGLVVADAWLAAHRSR